MITPTHQEIGNDEEYEIHLVSPTQNSQIKEKTAETFSHSFLLNTFILEWALI
jgi:hypothetical protein